MRAAGTDAVGALRWGLRRYRLLFIACLLLGAAVAPLWAEHRATTSEASALVIAQQLDTSLTALPRYGEAVFDNGQVAQAIAAQFGDLGDSEDIVPSRVSVATQQDSIVFRVIGRDPDPETAAKLADTAAAVFVDALNQGGVGVGSFSLQSPARVPVEAEDGLGTIYAVPVGLLAGLVLGLAAVSVLLVVRRPVIDGADAEEVAGVPSLGTVSLPGARRGELPAAADFAGLVPVCRRLLQLRTPIVVLVSRQREARARQQLSVALVEILGRVRDVHFVGPPELGRAIAERAAATSPLPAGDGAHGDADRLTFIDSGEPLDLVQPPEQTASILVVREGISSAALQTAVVEHLGGSAEPRILMIKRGRRWGRRSATHAGTAEPAAEDEHVALADRG